MKTRQFFLILAAAALTLSTIACGTINIDFGTETVRGSGDITTETYQVSGFDRVALGGAGRLEIIQDGSESVTVQTDDNLLEYLVVEVRGNTLHIEYDDGVSLNPTLMVVTLHAQDLERVEASGAWEVGAESLTAASFRMDVSGAGNVRIEDLTAESLEVNLSGAGQVEIAGQVASQEIAISGVGRYDAGDLRSETAQITISGTGNAVVWATETLEITISGAGRVDYYGTPQLTLQESGTSDVNSLGEK
ncbi:MAG: DUF2807 domain-containing protein [Anaerolineales bacterium]|nr:DUF2807 domain-containing protein [Anaerolineales bacterium]